MNRIFDFVKARYANAGRQLRAVNLAPRGRGVFMALAIVLGSAGQPLPARAAPASNTEYVYSVYASQAKGTATICVGDKVPIFVGVVRKQVENGEQTKSWYWPGIWVEGVVQDPSIGKMIITRKVTNMNNDPPGSVYFIFYAAKPGKTTLTFKAEIRYYVSTILKWLYGPIKIAESNPVDVTVEDCKFKVTAISRWKGYGLQQVAVINEAEMTADAPGHFTGKATVFWSITEIEPRPGCSKNVVNSTSKADLTGVMDEDGQQIVVDVAYQESDATWFSYLDDCTTQSSTEIMPYTPASLTLSVPSSGGVSPQSQELVHQAFPVMNISGSAKVAVVPVTWSR